MQLQGWKQIAEYLGVSVRTAQGWEAERGLPVYRVPGGRSGVWADSEEIEAWRRSAQAADSTAPSVNGTAAFALGDAARDDQPIVVSRPLRRLEELLRYRKLGFALVLVILAAATLLILGREESPNGQTERIPTRWLVERRLLTVLDATGEMIWKRDFSDDLLIPSREKVFVPEPWLGDVDDDGKVETVFAAIGRTGSALICYSQTGSEKWRFAPERVVKTRQESFDFFKLTNFVVFRSTAGAPLQLVVSSVSDPHYPCQIALLSSRGRLMSEYWHSGHLGIGENQMRVTDLDSDGREEILVTGISNGYKQATFVVLPSDSLAGASVEQNQDYQLLGFAKPNEKARLLFGKSCLNKRLAEPFNWTEGVQILPDSIMVGIAEEVDINGVGALYFFDRQLRLESIEVLEQFQRRHQDLLTAGEIAHPFSRKRCFPDPPVHYLSNTWE